MPGRGPGIGLAIARKTRSARTAKRTYSLESGWFSMGRNHDDNKSLICSAMRSNLCPRAMAPAIVIRADPKCRRNPKIGPAGRTEV
jgi:hypothetical protein